MREKFPPPYLTYPMYGLPDADRTPVGIIGDGPPLHDVHEVSAWWSRRGLTMYVRGPMLTKAGKRGPSRGMEVDVNAEGQPEWLLRVIADARARYEVRRD